MSTAESACGSWPSDLSLLKVSRQEMPASTRMRVLELSTIAVFPRLPLASTETETPMLPSIHSATVETGVTLWLSGTFEQSQREPKPRGLNANETAHQLLCGPALHNKSRRFRLQIPAQTPRSVPGKAFASRSSTQLSAPTGR